MTKTRQHGKIGIGSVFKSINLQNLNRLLPDTGISKARIRQNDADLTGSGSTTQPGPWFQCGSGYRKNVSFFSEIVIYLSPGLHPP
jgi:hypothetical protein